MRIFSPDTSTTTSHTSQALPGLNRLLPVEDMTRDWAWGGGSGRGVRVALIDSGIEASHPAVNGKVRGYVSIRLEEGELIYDTTPHSDRNGHATALAGIIRSFAPECELYSVQILNERLSCQSALLASALRWVLEQKIDLCNLSLGTVRKHYYSTLYEIANQAALQNTILIAAADNHSLPSYPSAFDSVISVASHNQADSYCFYYNPGSSGEFEAKGTQVRTAALSGEWQVKSGNSYAAAHLTGLVSRILSKHPGLNLYQLKLILQTLASPGTGRLEQAQASDSSRI
ncbi:MAG TPA: S8 family serine peptidase [Chloroflexia bacterium]|nr:S8 family serine peptidase [Chloroflexia bacterium]